MAGSSSQGGEGSVSAREGRGRDYYLLSNRHDQVLLDFGGAGNLDEARAGRRRSSVTSGRTSSPDS
eukprot:748717-Hanusia_phi.AAC.1